MTIPIRSFFLFAIVLVASGCGRDLKLSVQAAEAERDQPSAALVRKVEIAYHDPQGSEKARETIPVFGLSQPLAVKSEKMKDLDWDDQGVFEARGYSADGLLLLKGQTRTNDRGEAAVIMSRGASQASTLSSALLRRVRIVNTKNLSAFELDARELGKAMEQKRCVSLPEVNIDPKNEVSPPAIVFDASINSPDLKFETGTGMGAAFKVIDSKRTVSLSHAGVANIELGHGMNKGYLYKENSSFVIRLYSTQYEGCFTVATKLLLAPVITQFYRSVAASHYYPPNQGVGAAATMMVTNPNDATVRIRWQAKAFSRKAAKAVRFYHSPSNEVTPLKKLQLSDIIDKTIELNPHDSIGIGVFGTDEADPSFKGPFGLAIAGFDMEWSVVTMRGQEPMASESRRDPID